MKVDPEQLRRTAAAERDTSGFITGMQTGQSMTAAGAGLSGLQSAQACQFAGTQFDSAATAIGDELTTHSANLSTAAAEYQQTDEQLARRLTPGPLC